MYNINTSTQKHFCAISIEHIYWHKSKVFNLWKTKKKTNNLKLYNNNNILYEYIGLIKKKNKYWKFIMCTFNPG